MAEQQPLNATLVRAGDGHQDAEDLGFGIYMSRDVSNAYRIVTDAGDVLVNTGFPINGAENYRRLSAVSRNPIAKIVFTQSHPDHIGGWRWFNSADTETIAHANFEHVYGYFEGLREAMTRRSRHLWKRDLQETLQEFIKPTITTTFHDSYQFEVGGRQFELFSVPGGETLDSLIVWMPQDRVVFTGNLTGPIFGHVPNLYTLRGDKIRYVQWYLDSVQRVINLQPDVLITGHGTPLHGKDEICTQLSRIRDAVQYIKDQTFAGMNAGTSLWQLMTNIQLPPHLAIGQGHGKLPWLIRAIWEEHFGWFRFESTTEIYAVPPNAVYADMVDLAGADQLLTRAETYLSKNLPVQAMHLAEAVLTQNPNFVNGLNVLLRATEMQLEISGRENFSEVRWLESEISRLKERLAGEKP